MNIWTMHQGTRLVKSKARHASGSQRHSHTRAAIEALSVISCCLSTRSWCHEEGDPVSMLPLPPLLPEAPHPHVTAAGNVPHTCHTLCHTHMCHTHVTLNLTHFSSLMTGPISSSFLAGSVPFLKVSFLCMFSCVFMFVSCSSRAQTCACTQDESQHCSKAT